MIEFALPARSPLRIPACRRLFNFDRAFLRSQAGDLKETALVCNGYGFIALAADFGGVRRRTIVGLEAVRVGALADRIGGSNPQALGCLLTIAGYGNDGRLPRTNGRRGVRRG